MLNYSLYLGHPDASVIYLYLKTVSHPLCALMLFTNLRGYGKTSRNLLVRCREHLGINKLGQDVKSSGPFSIKDHIGKTGHVATFEDFSILAKTDNAFDLLIYESLLILRDRPSLNSQQSSIPLALF